MDGPHEDGFVKDARACFRAALAGAWNSFITDWVNNEFNCYMLAYQRKYNKKLTQQAFAETIGVAPGTLTKWLNGESISTEHLILLLNEFGYLFGELPFPSPQQMTADGWIAGLRFIRERLGEGSGTLDREEFFWLKRLYSDRKGRAEITRPDRLAPYKVFERLRPGVRQDFGKELSRVVDSDGLLRLHLAWERAWDLGSVIFPGNRLDVAERSDLLEITREVRSIFDKGKARPEPGRVLGGGAST